MKKLILPVLFLLVYLSAIPVCAQWTQNGQDIDGEAAGDASGLSASLSSDGKTLAIGAWRNDGNGTSAGHVRIFSWAAGAWSQVGADIDGEATGDLSGFSVSLSSDGKTLAVGARGNNGNGANSGHVRVFAGNASSWTQMGLDIDGESSGDASGNSVALSSDGKTLAIGAWKNDGNGAGAGHARVFTWDSTAWVQMGLDIDGEAAGDASGTSVALSADGETLAVGATNNDGNGADAGHVRVLSWNAGAWNQVGLDIDGEAAGDAFGWSVSLSSDGQTLAVGAWKNDGNGTDAGHVRVFNWSAGAWTQVGADIDGEAAGDASGTSISLSSDGKTLAIGAQNNDGNGTEAGHIRVFADNGGTWNQMGLDIDGEASGDGSGSSVSLSSDGQTLAIGAHNNDGNGADAGHVRVYTDQNVGIERAGIHELLRISPNPSNGLFDLQYDAASQGLFKIQITDLRGRIILEKEARATEGSNKFKLNIQDQPLGIYILKTVFNSRLYSAKLINL